MFAIRWKSPTGCVGGGLYVLSEAQADDWLKYLNSAHRDYTHWKAKEKEKEQGFLFIKCGEESGEVYKNRCNTCTPDERTKKERLRNWD